MQPGDQVGHYKILERLGKGGMGEVFAAEDSRLHRRIALKVLPQILSRDSAARQRFEREAQAVAALNHPNIVTIHSVEEHDGGMFLTMELVDGQPLSESIPSGGIPLERLLRIGIDVADAMSAAQQRGITHRDVKPANIMLTASGRVKVLDFGLAKVHEAQIAGASDDLTRMSSRDDITGEGKIIGTVAYMSPEQAEGKPVDPRSDIFSLGVVLHEMATGERPFKGDTNVSVISAIIKDTPAPVTDTNPKLPAELARIIRRCLTKDPERRYQTAADLRNELEELKQDTASGVITVARSTSQRPRRTMAMAAMAAAVVAIGIIGWLAFNKAPMGPKGSQHFTIDRLTRLTNTGSAFLAAISPDARYVVHAKGEPEGLALWVRQTATASDVRIVPAADVRFDGLAFSPDGNYVYYSFYPADGSGVASLYRVPVLGGTATKVIEDIDSPVSFSPDGTRIAFTRGSMTRGTTEVIIADVNGSVTRSLATAPSGDRFQSERAAWSPDGTVILASAASTRPGVPAAIYAIEVASGTARTVGEPWGMVRELQWLPDGRSFLATAIDLSGMATPQIWQIEYPSGARTRVTNDLNSYVGASLAADGQSLATVQTETVAHLYVLDAPGTEPRRLTSGSARADGATGIAWLPDGRVVYSSTASGLPQLWISKADGSEARQITSLQGPATAPSTALDGQWIYFSSFAREGSAIFRVAPDGSGLKQLTTTGDASVPLVSADGRTVYLTSQRSGTPQLMKMPADGGTPERVFDKFFRASGISFDGTRLVGATWNEERRRTEVAVLELATLKLDALDTGNALFMPDGSLAVVRRIQGKSMLFSEQPGRPRKQLFAGDEQFILNGAVARDGRIAFAKGSPTSDVVLIKAK